LNFPKRGYILGRGIDWGPTFETRVNTHKGVLVTDQSFIDAFLEVLKYFEENGEGKIDYFYLSKGLQPREQLRVDDFVDDMGEPNPCAFLRECRNQISEHRQLWHVHHDKTEHVTIDTGVVVKTELRYVKFQFEAKKKIIGDPKEIKQFLIDYHKNNKGNPKVYWNYEKI
jgi:hypothetical protein